MTFLKKTHWIGIIFSVIVFAVDFIFFRGENLFYFLIGISVAVLALPFVIATVIETGDEKEKMSSSLNLQELLLKM